MEIVFILCMYKVINVYTLQFIHIYIYYNIQDGYTSLHFAAKNGHLEVVKLLIEKGANLQDKDSVSNIEK